MSIHLKSSIFKELRVAEVSVVLKGIEGAAVGDAAHIHVRALRVKTLSEKIFFLSFNFPPVRYGKL